MPRRKLSPRLVLRELRQSAEDQAAGGTRREWVIRDGSRYERTGCAEGEIGQAEKALAEYLGEKHEPVRSGGKASDLSIADVLTIYLEDQGARTARPGETDASIGRLNDFWGTLSVGDIKGPKCREYVAHRAKEYAKRHKGAVGGSSGARRDLENLRAAVRHYKREHGMEFEPLFWLPPKSQPRERWLTRSEAARLIWACWRSKWKRHRHLARFILISIYTATRKDAVTRLQWRANTMGGWIDVDEGKLYRRADGTRQTKKRQPVARVPERLLAHCRRWKRLDKGIPFVVHYQGHPLSRMKTSFATALKAAALDDGVVPHSLRHTAITWLMQEGVDPAEVSGFAGVSIEELQRTYWHHHPDFQAEVASVRMGNRANIRAKTAREEAQERLSR